MVHIGHRFDGSKPDCITQEMHECDHRCGCGCDVGVVWVWSVLYSYLLPHTQMPRIQFRSNAKPSLYAYPPPLEKEKEREKEKVGDLALACESAISKINCT